MNNIVVKKNLISSAIFASLLLAGCGQNSSETANKVTENTATVTPTKGSVESKVEASEEAKLAQTQLLSRATQADLDKIAEMLVVRYQQKTNIPTDKCDPDTADGACFEVVLNFTAPKAISVDDWAIYFSQISPVQSFESDWASITHINGDLHKITLKEEFVGFATGETKSITFRANFWSLSETDALPNYILAGESAELMPRVIASTKVQIDAETGLEILPYVVPYTDEARQFKRTPNDKTEWLTAEKLFERNESINDWAQEHGPAFNVASRIVPSPKQSTLTGGYVDISKGLTVNWQMSDEVRQDDESINVALARLSSLGITFSDDGLPLNLHLTADEENSAKESQERLGSYTLKVTPKGIDVSAGDMSGLFYGLQSLASIKVLDSKTLPQMTVIDEPHYGFRGLLVDVARNFRSKAFILDLLDQMAAYKLNKLHLHLGDDEGWRLEIPNLPELTEVSSKRCFDPSETTCLLPQLGAGVDASSEVNGYYSVADYKEILAAATARHIQVIPSLDMPGHSRAAVKAMAARYQKYMALEQEEKALEFLLHDPLDKTVYSSVQYYNDNTINVCLDSSYRFIERVMTDVKAIHADAGQPLTRYHIGADETAGAWLDSPACQTFLAKHDAEIASAKELGAYFVERIANMLADLGIEAAAWIDGLEHTNPDNMPAVIQANAWHPLAWEGHKSAHKLANYNWQIVVSSPDVTYFDFPYEADPKEHGYYWASRQINSQKLFNFMPDNLPANAEWMLDREDNSYVADDRVLKDKSGKLASAPLNQGVTFLGLQGQLWSENTRTDNTAEYKLFPRLLALAERAWYSPAWALPYDYQGKRFDKDSGHISAQAYQQRDQDWYRFAYTLGHKELAKLSLSNVHYRLPTAGGKVIDGKLNINTAYPGLATEYKVDDSGWQPYQTPVAVSGKVLIRATDYQGQRKGRALALEVPTANGQ